MTLLALVTLAKTNGNAVEYLQERLRAAEERRDRREVQMIRLALHHAQKNLRD